MEFEHIKKFITENEPCEDGEKAFGHFEEAYRCWLNGDEEGVLKSFRMIFTYAPTEEQKRAARYRKWLNEREERRAA